MSEEAVNLSTKWTSKNSKNSFAAQDDATVLDTGEQV